MRGLSEALCDPLEIEDYALQSMPSASPPKWHLAHTTWFFETFVLSRDESYEPADPRFRYLFNSYYDSVGERHLRSERGLLSRPSVAEVYAYRAQVEDSVRERLRRGIDAETEMFVVLGLHHEQQHQELLVTDLKHAFSRNVLRPVYHERRDAPVVEVPSLEFHGFDAGLYEIGTTPGASLAEFAYDNEGPVHPHHLQEFEIGGRLVTVGEYIEFMADGGYERPQFWLSDGWTAACEHKWHAPEYWYRCENGEWWTYTLAGPRALRLDEPVCHVSFYEADAYARWLGRNGGGYRLPTEQEWEVAARSLEGPAVETMNFVESESFHPVPEREPRFLGNTWCWTRSAYSPYPGYLREAGALGEYNGKFMCNQIVLRGGSCATPETHIRPTYRNFFPPESRWQFSGIRLAR